MSLLTNTPPRHFSSRCVAIPERDWSGEVRAALYKCHGLRAWEIALESGRDELVAYVEDTTGGAQISGDAISLCGVVVVTLRHGFLLRRPPVPGFDSMCSSGCADTFKTSSVTTILNGATPRVARHVDQLLYAWLGDDRRHDEVITEATYDRLRRATRSRRYST